MPAPTSTHCGKPVHYRQSWVLVPITDEQLRAREDYRKEERARMESS